MIYVSHWASDWLFLVRPRACLCRLNSRKYEWVRLRVTENVMAPPVVLLRLAKDENPFVAARAQRSIELRAQAGLFLN